VIKPFLPQKSAPALRRITNCGTPVSESQHGMPHPIPGFAETSIFDWLESATDATLDQLPFGVVALAQDGSVAGYNAAESALSGMTRERVLGRPFFTGVAPCTNNFMVAHRYETEPELDATIDYVFTFKIAPVSVPLRSTSRP
jgi:photoactive yellow protein